MRLLTMAVLFTAAGAVAIPAAQVGVLSAGAVEPGLVKLAEQYRRDTGHDVEIQFGTAPQLARRLADGDVADVLIAPTGVVDQAVKDGRVVAETRAIVGRVGAGVTVRRGAGIPDVTTVDALTRALRGADSIVYNQASTGLYLEKLFDKLGLGDELRPKTTRYATGAQVLEHVIKGRGNEMGFGAITEIREYEPKGLTLVGPLPAEVQNYTTYEAVVMTAAASATAGRDLIRYLTTPAAKQAFAATGVQ